MKEYFVIKYALYQVEFFRDYISSKDIWYDIAIDKAGVNTKYRMHNNNNRIWKIAGTRTPPFVLKLEEDFSEAIGRNEVYI